MEAEFLRFAMSHGVYIDPRKLFADGKRRRANSGEDSHGRGDATYVLRPDGSGWVVNWRGEGERKDFFPKKAQDVDLSVIRSIQERRAEDGRRQQDAARRTARALWGASLQVESHGYLRNPELAPHGLRVVRRTALGADRREDDLIAPMVAFDGDGALRIVGAQRIASPESGTTAKRFLAGTNPQGGFVPLPICFAHPAIPGVQDVITSAWRNLRRAEVVLVEGVGTGLAVVQATKRPVICALSASNLALVAMALRDHSNANVVVFADRDGDKGGRIGQSSALGAARVLGARARIAIADGPSDGYDARDLLRDAGAPAVASAIASATDADEFEATFVQDAPKATAEGRSDRCENFS